MDTLILIATMALTAAQPTQSEIDRLCQSFHDIAYDIHAMRYNGVPIGPVLKVFEGDVLYREIAIKAYKRPRFGSDENIIKDRQEFALQNHLICLQIDWE